MSYSFKSKQCHDYHLNKCKKKNCKFSHEGLPMNKCIFGGANNCQRCKSEGVEPITTLPTVNIHSLEEKKKSFTKPNDQQKQCHDYHLKGSCPDQKNCRFSHEGVPLLKCILGSSCRYCTKKEEITDNRCHDYHLNYCKRVNCTYSHEGAPENKCINIGGSEKCSWCKRKILKECHNYHLNKCNKLDCDKSHTGVPQNKCIYGIMCYKCNFACHTFATTGKCNKYKCKFDHISPPELKCPFGETNCFLCNFRRVKRKKCHFQQKYGKCEIPNCKSSHKVPFTKVCTNFLCKFCLKENGQLKNQNLVDKIQGLCQKISVNIDDPNINPDSLKAAEQVIDDKIMSTLVQIPEKQIEDSQQQQLNEMSFFPYEFNSNQPEQALTACRQILKKFLGFNYVIANDAVQVCVKGEGQIITSQGQQVPIMMKESTITMKDNNLTIQSDYIYAVNVITRDETYYNNQQKKNQEEEKKMDVDAISQQLNDKSKNKQKSKLKESIVLVVLQPLNTPILGEFVVDIDQNFQLSYTYNSQNEEFGINKLIQQNIKRLELISTQPDLKQNQELNKCQLEIAFVLDTTSSMQPYINESKNTIIQIIKEIEKKVPKTRFMIKYGVVAYRDHPPQDNTYVTQFQNFEESIEKSIKYIQELQAHGGGDTPEAVFDGLYQASNLKWSQDDQSYGGCQRIVIHIADAPPHGKQYSKCDSEWKDGCPCKIDIKQISNLFNSQEISYNLLTIGNNLEKTVKIFSRYFQQFDYRDIKKNEVNQQTKMILAMLEKFPWWQIA